jgi:hypothetical protein
MLALLFGWTQAGDHPFIYENAPPHLVHSVDHGHFFPNGPDWTVATLEAAPQRSQILESCQGQACRKTTWRRQKEEFVPANDVQIAYAVAAPPSDWLTVEERVAMAQYLSSTRRTSHASTLLGDSVPPRPSHR